MLLAVFQAFLGVRPAEAVSDPRIRAVQAPRRDHRALVLDHELHALDGRRHSLRDGSGSAA